MVAPESPYNRSRMSGARELPVLENKSVRFALPEDAILMKRTYFQEGQSDKHLRPVLAISIAAQVILSRVKALFETNRCTWSRLWNGTVGTAAFTKCRCKQQARAGKVHPPLAY